MASRDSLLCEKQFQCSICLRVFTDPVTTPCGHNFCEACLRGAWGHAGSEAACRCPTCDKAFPSRPDISVNTAFKELVDMFGTMAAAGVSSAAGVPPLNVPLLVIAPDEVACDVCLAGTVAQLRALKSCLVCLTSYCHDHLEPHRRVAALARHTLIEPVRDLDERICTKHSRLLDMFCRDDGACVCRFCAETEHKAHRAVTIEEESGEIKVQMKDKEAEFGQLIQDRLKKAEEIKQCLEQGRVSAKREKVDSERVFASLRISVEKSRAQAIEEMEEKQREAERRAEGLLRELEEEITELQRRSGELEQLEHTEDHLHLLQRFPSLSSLPPTREWSETGVSSDLCVGTVRRALSKLDDTVGNELDRLKDQELKRMQRYAIDVVLDPDTAHPNIVLSADGKQVGRGDLMHVLPDNPQRFDPVLCILGKRGFLAGRFYFQVHVGAKTFWDMGVVRESINRKGMITSTPENGYWTVRLRGGDEYRALESPSVLLRLREKPRTVGVFVDYEEGSVSFFNVEDKSHMYSFVGHRFTERLFPFLSPSVSDEGRNVAPLVITAVNQATSS